MIFHRLCNSYVSLAEGISCQIIIRLLFVISYLVISYFVYIIPYQISELNPSSDDSPNEKMHQGTMMAFTTSNQPGISLAPRPAETSTSTPSLGHGGHGRIGGTWIWANYNNSLTWIKAILGWFPLLTTIPVRSQWGRYNLPIYMYIHIHTCTDNYIHTYLIILT